MSLAEELLADLEEDGYDDSEPMVVIQEETPHELQDNALIPKQTGIFCRIYYLHTIQEFIFFKYFCRF